MTAQIEARCDHCQQPRRLFLYEPDHGMHPGAGAYTCRWCTREKQPLLRVRCWDAERAREEADPVVTADMETLAKICENNARAEQRRAADRETCEGIAAATEEAHTT